jgi:hypothetical protein
VDQAFTSSETTFDAVKGQADAQFPVKVPSGTEVSALVDRLGTRVQSAQTAADGASAAAGAASAAAGAASAAASSASDSANKAFTVGAGVGGAGIFFGLVGIALALRARRKVA